ncbi:hypothetical protein GCM10009665_57620 [Kitasatospora nipponensis]|uniref:Uncharacterized protein n=1 Tax=Kitasatospora nipponensis TaxID=258049 RepID=A0ABP4HCY7_9ACTN
MQAGRGKGFVGSPWGVLMFCMSEGAPEREPKPAEWEAKRVQTGSTSPGRSVSIYDNTHARVAE